MYSEFNNIKISGMVTAVPRHTVNNMDYVGIFSEEEIRKQIKVTGICERHCLAEGQSIRDLNYAALHTLMEKTKWQGNDVDVIIYVSAYNHGAIPATAYDFAKQIGAKQECVAYDINLGCSGFIIGVYIASALLRDMPEGSKGIVVVSDTTTVGEVLGDRSLNMLPGDCATATAVEVTKNGIANFKWNFDGSRYQYIYRKNMEENLKMDGMSVFEFGIEDVADSIREYFEHYEIERESCDCFVLHQAQKYMVRKVAQFSQLPKDKVLTSYDLFGNTGGPSLPATLCANIDKFEEKENIKVFFAGYGSGLSWGMVILDIETKCVCPVVYVE